MKTDMRQITSQMNELEDVWIPSMPLRNIYQRGSQGKFVLRSDSCLHGHVSCVLF